MLSRTDPSDCSSGHPLRSRRCRDVSCAKNATLPQLPRGLEAKFTKVRLGAQCRLPRLVIALSCRYKACRLGSHGSPSNLDSLYTSDPCPVPYNSLTYHLLPCHYLCECSASITCLGHIAKQSWQWQKSLDFRGRGQIRLTGCCAGRGWSRGDTPICRGRPTGSCGRH